MSASARLPQAISELSDTGTGCVQIRTREPLIALSVIAQFAKSQKRATMMWSCSDGLETSKGMTLEKTESLSDAFRTALKVREPTVFAFLHAHPWLLRDPVAQHLAFTMTHKFPLDQRRAFFVTPPGVVLPDELVSEIPVIDMGYPEEDDLLLVYGSTADGLHDLAPKYAPADERLIIQAAAGMLEAEFQRTLNVCFIHHQARLPGLPLDVVLKAVRAAKAVAIRRSDVLELLEPIPMADIGGLDALKEWLRKRAVPAGTGSGIDPCRGFALVGPPGTGKSAAARATAEVLGIPLIRLDIGKVFGSLVGQSEARLRDALALVDTMAPCVLLVDEVDKAFDTRSGGGDSGVGRRVLGTLLTWMSDAKAGVVVVMTANRVDCLPAELLRRGRLDEIFAVGMPDEKQRRAVLDIHLRKRGRSISTGMEEAVTASAGYVPAEIESAVKDSLIEAQDREIDLTGQLIAECLRGIVPQSKAFAGQFEAMKRWAEENARAA